MPLLALGVARWYLEKSTDMTAVTPEDRIKEIAGICYRTSGEATGIIEFLEAGNTQAAQAALDKRTAPVANVIRKAMFERLVMAVMRMHDKPASDRETLPRAFDLLSDQTVFQNLAMQGDAARLRSAITRWDLLSTDPKLTDIRNTRDFDVAHIIPTKNGLPRPRIMEFYCVVRETTKVVEDLAAGTGICSVSFDAISQVWAERAQAYWSRLLG